MKRLLLLIYISLLCNLYAVAQHSNYQFSHLSVSNGLSNNQVTSILKDSRGFIWFGTAAGLNRFDGFKFETFKSDPKDLSTLNDDNIVSITEGPNQKLWVRTKKGLNIYNPQTEKFTADLKAELQLMGIGPCDIYAIFKLKEDEYALSCSDLSLYIYNALTKRINHILPANNMPDRMSTALVNSVAMGTANDNIWIMHNNGVLEQFSLVKNTVLRRLNLASKTDFKPVFYATYVDRERGLWIYGPGSDIGIYFYDATNGVLKHFDKSSAIGKLNTDIVNAVTQDDDGLMWIATDHGGINMLNKKGFKTSYLLNRDDDIKSVAQNSLQSIYKDDQGIVWAGTYKKGISYFHKNIIKFPLFNHHFSDPNSLPFDDVNRFAEDARGNLWIGTNGGGLIYFDRAANTFKQYKHSANNSNTIGNDVIVSLCVDHQQKLWIGSYFGGLDCFDGHTFTHYKHKENDPSSLSDDRVWAIMEDAQNRLWVGTLAGGVNLFDPTRHNFYHYRSEMKNSIHSNYISSLAEGASGSIWVSSGWGIDLIKGSGSVVHYLHNEKDANSLLLNNIYKIFIDTRGWVWASTREGLSIINPKTGNFTNLRKDNGLPDNNIKDVQEENDHSMWISTANGLSNMIITAATDKRFEYRFNNYGEADGLQGLEFNVNASFKTSKGELIFGGANGFNLFDPAGIAPSNSKPAITLTGFQVFNDIVKPGQATNGHVILSTSIAETRQLTLNYDENVFSIAFASLDFFSPDKIKIEYKLEGFDKGWLTTDNNTRKVTYTNLEPGRYTFLIKPVNNKISGQRLALQILIKPPFWKTQTAYFLYTCAFFAGLYFIRKRGINKIKAQFTILQEREQAQRLHELDMMKIKFFTNVSHEFRTPLSLILAPVDKMLTQNNDENQRQQLKLIGRNAKRLLNLVNQLLDFRKMEVQELRLHTLSGDIIKFIEEAVLSFSDIAEKKNIDFVFDSDVSSFETKFDHDKIERILFNLVSNAFKFTPEHGHVSVLLNIQKESLAGKDILVIKVIDTGIGIDADKLDKIFERFFQNDVPGTMVNQGSGIGLAITREFVKLHNGEITVESEAGQGSCFIVKLPLTASGEQSIESLEPTPVVLAAPELLEADKTLSKKQMVLLVEDNDDFRFYLRDNLKAYFQVVEAANGREGWQKALALHPALIVSDVSMPEMNGIDLCNKLKNDARTTHIPVVLLTAIIGEEGQLRGLETGATDYLTKPFNFEILLSKLKNILLQQDMMRKTYKKQVDLKPSDVVLDSPDEQFIQKALHVIEKNIDNTEFSVEELSSEMCMSRVTLYKKTLALTGKSPVDLIRTVRLKRAAQLLESGYLTISQVSYKVGFRNQRYFTKSFRAEYNMLPSEYAARRKEELVK